MRAGGDRGSALLYYDPGYRYFRLDCRTGGVFVVVVVYDLVGFAFV